MTPINNLDELKQLEFGEKFYVISDDNVNSYLHVGNHPRSDKLCVAIWDADYTSAKVFSNNSFRKRLVFLKGKYNSATIGDIMISHLLERQQSIKEIYFKETIK